MRKGYTTPQPKQRSLLLHGCALYKVEKVPTLSTLQQQRWPICKKADGSREGHKVWQVCQVPGHSSLRPGPAEGPQGHSNYS